MPDLRPLRGTLALVTGATSGLGFETARALADRGARVVLAARTRERGEEAAGRILAEDPGASLVVAAADLSSRAGVRSLARDVLAAGPRLGILVSNAAAVRADRHETADGLEWTFAVNHLAPFFLTRLLLSALRPGGRVVVVTSDAHRDASLDLDDLQSAHAYDALVAYRRSKLANVLFARALARRTPSLSVAAVAPGVTATDIVREAPPAFRAAWAAGARPAAVAARWIVDAAVDPAPAGPPARYVSEGRETEPSREACDDALADRLWDACAALTG